MAGNVCVRVGALGACGQKVLYRIRGRQRATIQPEEAYVTRYNARYNRGWAFAGTEISLGGRGGGHPPRGCCALHNHAGGTIASPVLRGVGNPRYRSPRHNKGLPYVGECRVINHNAGKMQARFSNGMRCKRQATMFNHTTEESGAAGIRRGNHEPFSCQTTSARRTPTKP